MSNFSLDMVIKYGLEFLPSIWEYRPAGRRGTKVQGFGINDVEFACKPTIKGNRVDHPAYVDWVSLLSRCYSESSISRRPNYAKVTCSDDWLYFSNFLSWWRSNYIYDYVLDKDIKHRGNTVYGPDTCVFVHPRINTFINCRGNDRGPYPLGVTKIKSRFRSRINSIVDGSEILLGYFDTEKLAHATWQAAKIELAKQLQEDLHTNVLTPVILRLQNDLDNNQITETI